MNKYVSKYMQLSLQYVSDGGTLAEEVISTIRTAQAFGTQTTLANIYDTHIAKSREGRRTEAYDNLPRRRLSSVLLRYLRLICSCLLFRHHPH